jgi:diguanylate cyclase (GGDEF)-like protein
VANKALIPVTKQQQIAFPGTVIALLVNLFLILYLIGAGLRLPQSIYSFSTAILTSLYFLLLYQILIPWSAQDDKRRWLVVGLNCLVVAGVQIIEAHLPSGYITLIRLCVLIQTAILFGRFPAYSFIGIVVLVKIITDYVIRTSVPDDAIQSYLVIPMAAILITETMIRLQESLTIELNRLRISNKVARSLASSLEAHQVIALVSSAVQNALDADTYYMGTLNGDSVHLELLYDDGEFFPSMDIPLKDTLAGYVVETGKSLLISDLAEAHKRLNIAYKLVGKPRVSQSWMGVLLESGNNLTGLIAVASYKKNAFDQGDLELLENVAQQAAMALDNAGHHSEVEIRSQLDSLTGALNHNALLVKLDRSSRDTLSKFNSLSLIMLDIDHFKRYNDKYGHLIGDQVLILLTQAIQRCIKKADILGRWGGEEFVVGLPNTDTNQAYAIAERIRVSLGNLNITDRDNKRIAPPTISQGIATMPFEAEDIEQLIDLADQRLYIAKERGRNQIEPDLSLEIDQPEKSAVI